MKIFFKTPLVVVIILILLLTSDSAFAGQSRKEKWATFLNQLNRASAEKKLKDAYNKSPYTKYAQNYTRLYRTGQISQKEYNDRMMEIETLEMNRKREMTNSIVSYAVATKINNMDYNDFPIQASAPQIINGPSRQRVTDQYGNTVAYIDEN